MAKENMFDSVFEKPVAEPAVETETVSEKPVQDEKPNEPDKCDGLFRLKNVPEKDRRPTTIIFTRENLAFLKKLAVDENANMSELVNRWLEGLQAEG